MTSAYKGIFIVGAKRTPFCKYGGYLREMPASQIFAVAAKDAMHSANLDAALMDNTTIGNVHYLSQCDGGKTPRYCDLYSGVPIDRPALGVNKSCGSGLQAIISAALDIRTETAKICLAGGTDVMSSLPLFVRNVRFGSSLGSAYNLEDPLRVGTETSLELVRVSERIAQRYRIGRDHCDEYTLRSRLKWMKAQQTGVFNGEITNMRVTRKSKEFNVEMDEIHSPEMTMDDLKKMPPVGDQRTVVTKGNSSAPADGAAAVVLADGESVRSLSLTPLARVVGWACVGCNEAEYGLEAAVVVKKLLQDLKLTIDDIDGFEINETFASQAIATIRDLKIDEGCVNICGGGLSVGDPTAATGSRMAVHIAHRISHRHTERAVAASSCGVGQGVAVMFERL